MSEDELIERALKNVAAPTISTDTGLVAARELGKAAAAESIAWAVAGGLAMYLYGSPRLTKDVDIIAAGYLSRAANASLNIGGSSYLVEIGRYKVTVDWIVRGDGYAKYYGAALAQAVALPNDIHLITPEWLLILKMFAGRQKDYDDAIFLLQQANLVNRSQVKSHIVSVGGEDAWLAVIASFRRLCSLADNRANEPEKYYLMPTP